MDHQNWLEINGDETLALDWNLNENSTVWEIGGFTGRWAGQIVDKFNCNIVIFEPQMFLVEMLHKKFAGNEKVTIYPFGLWTQTEEKQISSFGT